MKRVVVLIRVFRDCLAGAVYCLLLGSMAFAESMSGAEKIKSLDQFSNSISYRNGDVVLSLLDATDKHRRFWNRVVGLGGITLTLNGLDLGTFQRDSIILMTPRLGLNELILSVPQDPEQQTRLTFGAMRSAGSANQVVELSLSGGIETARLNQLRQADIERIGLALGMSDSGGLSRARTLIRSRGRNDDLPIKQDLKQILGGIINDLDFGSNDNDEQNTRNLALSEQKFIQPIEETLIQPSDVADETGRNDASFNVSADRR